MNKEKFNEFMRSWLKEQNIQPPAEWSKVAQNWAVENGLLIDEHGNYSWRAPLTREELAMVLNHRENGIL